MKWSRAPNLLVSFMKDEAICHDLKSSWSFRLDASEIEVLARCWTRSGGGRSINDVAKRMNCRPEQLAPTIMRLQSQGLLSSSDAPCSWRSGGLSRALEQGWNLFELAAHRNGRHTPGFIPNRTPQPRSLDQKWLSLPDLPMPEVALAACLRKRHSRRSFGSRPLETSELSRLLITASCPVGTITQEEEKEAEVALKERVALTGRIRYPYPTPGARNGLRLFMAAGNVNGFREGLYRFDQDTRQLLELLPVPFGKFCSQVLPGLNWVARAALVILVSGEVAPLRRNYRHPLLLCLSEAGHLLQNVLLVATALNLASCELGSIEEDALFALVGRDDYSEVPMGAIAIGPIQNI